MRSKARRARTRKHWAVYTRSPEGRWRVRVPGIEGAESTGRTLREARRKLEKVLARIAPELDLVAVVDRVHLTAEARRALTSYRAARRALERAEDQVRRRGKRSAGALTRKMGLSVRDTAALLGVSPARVQQLLG